MRLRHGAEKAHRIRLCRAREERIDRGTLDSSACIHDHDVVGNAGNDAEVVGDDDDSGARLLLGDLEDIQDLGLDRHIESRRRLVGDDDLRIVRDCDSNDDTLAHATGELVRIRIETVLRIGDADKREELDAALVHVLLAHLRVVDEKGLCELVADGEHRRESAQRVLEDHGDPRSAQLRHLLVGLAEQLLALELDRALDMRIVVEKADQ